MVCAVAVHPKGTALATGGTDHTVRVWDARTARESLILRGHTWTVRSVVFTPDGRYIISGGQDKAIKIWDATHDPRGRLLPPTNPANAVWVNAVAFTPEGRMVLLGGAPVESWQPLAGMVKVLDPVSGRHRSFSGVSGTGSKLPDCESSTKQYCWPERAVLSPDGRTVYVADNYGDVHGYEVATGQVRRPVVVELDLGVAVRLVADHEPGAAQQPLGDLVEPPLVGQVVGQALRFEQQLAPARSGGRQPSQQFGGRGHAEHRLVLNFRTLAKHLA